MSTPQDDVFVLARLAEWQADARRAEPLYALAGHFRSKGQHQLALLFGLAGMRMQPPEGVKVAQHVYDWALQYEVTQAGRHCGAQQQARALQVADGLLRDPRAPGWLREIIRQQRQAPAASTMFKTLECWRSNFAPPLPDGWHVTNPSVAVIDGGYWATYRAVNYLTDQKTGETVVADRAGIGRSRNFLAALDGPKLQAVGWSEIPLPVGLPMAPQGRRALGLEDMRLFARHGGMWVIASTAEHSGADRAAMVLQCLEKPSRWWFCADHGRNQKNWMPMGDGRFVYSVSPLQLVDHQGRLLGAAKGPPAPLRGGSQALALGDGRWLCVVHEPGALDRHRFCRFDEASGEAVITPPFHLVDPDTEFVAGLCHHDDGRLLISFGVGDREAWFATIGLTEVLGALA